MAQFDLTVTAFWNCTSDDGGLSVEQSSENVSVTADTESDISDASIRAALSDIAPVGCSLNSYTVEGIFSPEPGGLITVYAIAKFDCGSRGMMYRTFRIDVPVTSTRDEVLDEMLLVISAQIESSPDRYDCEYRGFDITEPLFYQYSSGG